MSGNEELLRRIRLKSGLSMTRSGDFETLAREIHDKTRDSLGVNTLKRLFGFNSECVSPRLSTLDIIARYLDMPDYESLAKMLDEDACVSRFVEIEGVDVCRLSKGDRVRISYFPDRAFTLTYIGDSRFEVDEVSGSRNILPGDLLTIGQFAKGHRLVVSNVRRGNEDLGAYEAACEYGLKSVEILSPSSSRDD